MTTLGRVAAIGEACELALILGRSGKAHLDVDRIGHDQLAVEQQADDRAILVLARVVAAEEGAEAVSASTDPLIS